MKNTNLTLITLALLANFILVACGSSVETDTKAYCDCFDKGAKYLDENGNKGSAEEAVNNAKREIDKCLKDAKVDEVNIKTKYPRPEDKDKRAGSDYEKFRDITMECDNVIYNHPISKKMRKEQDAAEEGEKASSAASAGEAAPAAEAAPAGE